MPLEDIKELPSSYLQDVWFVLSQGVEGWYSESDQRYMMYQSLFSYSKDNPKPFKDVFPAIYKMRTLGRNNTPNLAAKWMLIKPKRNKG